MTDLRIFTLPLGAMRVNCYLLRDGATGRGVIVDPGGDTSADVSRILDKCAAEAIEVTAILLTHTHFDHIGSLEPVREATGAPLCVHRYDEEALFHPHLSYMAQFAGIEKSHKPAERLLEDGDSIEIGASTLEVLHTPGHTIGSVCYKGGGFILTGDTLFRGSIGRYDLYGGDEMAMAQSLARLKALAKTGDYKLYPGHGSSTSLSRELAENFYLK